MVRHVVKKPSIKGRLILPVGCFLTLSLVFSACPFARTDEPLNPSYRLVTQQIAAIDSALGTRGGLAGLTRTSTTPSIPPVMTHGSSIDVSSLRSSGEVKLNWALIGSRVSTIEDAWKDVRLELDRRSVSRTDASWDAYYLQYFRIMAAKHYFDLSLEGVKLDVSTKNRERVELSVLMLTEAYIQVKDVLKVADVDGRRLAFVSAGFVAILAAFTATTSLVARRRDRKFVRPPRSGQPGQPSGS